MPKMTPPRTDARMPLRHPTITTKRQRDAIRKRWRAAIVDDFGTVSSFRSAWENGSRGQLAAEAVYRFLQDENRTKDTEEQRDFKFSTIVAFAEMTGRTVGFLLTGQGPERDGELRARTELVHDMSAVLSDVIPSTLRSIGLRVHGTAAMAFLLIKVADACAALDPLVALGSIVDAQFLLPSHKKQLVRALEAASRQVTAECPGLLTLDGRTLLHTTLKHGKKPHPNPALRRTVEESTELARLNVEAMDRAVKAEESAALMEHV